LSAIWCLRRLPTGIAACCSTACGSRTAARWPRFAMGLPISRQAVTKHLKVLEDANLVLTRKQGREKLHYLNPVPIHAIAMRWLGQFDSVKLDALLALENAGG
jgi:DNA-binding transcriptional ArsR family regulator